MHLSETSTDRFTHLGNLFIIQKYFSCGVLEDHELYTNEE
jgi:hypothetical protein